MTTGTAAGRTILLDLRNRLDGVRAEAARVRGEFDAIDRRIDDYIAQRGAAIVELAKLDLPDISRENVERGYAGIRDELLAIVARKERAQQELLGRLQRLQQSVDALQADVDRETEALNQLVARRAELERIAAERLAADAGFVPLRDRALQAEAQLQAHEERAEEVQLEASQKLPAYNRSSLFQYLWRREFGTPQYPHRGWTRALDRWVARLIDYERCRRGYEFLRRTPPLVEAEVARRRKEFHALMEQVEAIEDRVSDEVGLTAVLRQGTEQGARRDELVARLTAEQQRAAAAATELSGLEQQQGRFYQEALQRYVRFLADTETTVLQSRASQTANPADDELVARIAWLTHEINRLRPDVDALHARSQRAESLTEGLSFVVRRAEMANFDSDRCEVRDLRGVAQDVERFLAGAMNKDDLWRAIQQRAQFAPTWVETAAVGAGEMLRHPASHVLLEALVRGAAAAMAESAGRSVQRRAGPSQSRRVELGRPTPNRGFSTRRGF